MALSARANAHSARGCCHGPINLATTGVPIERQSGVPFECRLTGFIGEPINLAPLPDLASVRRELLAMFPYAEPVIGTALEPMSGARHVVMTPTILAGPPGVGKTYFAESLARVLGLPFEIYQCTAISDAALAGTPRSGMNPEPSLPVSVVRAHRHASPVIVLDQLDKASFLDALLG